MGIKMKKRKSILQVDGVTKRFPGVIALSDVSIELYENEILALVGENGAGKSTLMKILSGSYIGYDGLIQVGGDTVCFSSTKCSEKAGIAMIYQELNMEIDLSVAENIFIGMYPKTKLGLVNWKKMNSEAKIVLEKLGLDIDPSIEVRDLNASLQQLVSIARALVRKPKILILDEPTASLTEEETSKLIKVINDLKDSGISCIYISHKLDEVFNICDRIVVMRDGMNVSEYLREDIQPAVVIEDMVGRKLDKMYPKSNRKLGDELLRVENMCVKHQYAHNKNIIEDISFTVKRGEILGLAGLVGSGRSELLRGIYGGFNKIRGKVFVEGKEITIKNPADAIAKGIGFLTEERKNDGFVPMMSIKENMTLTILKEISKYGLFKHKEERKIAKKYFDYLNVKAPNLNSNIETLSGGNQQKVILARTLLADTKILFLDEPTRGIDIGAKSEIYKIMEELVEEGLSIVMISSELPELLAMCDRFIVIGKGEVLGEFDKSQANESVIIHTASQL